MADSSFFDAPTSPFDDDETVGQRIAKVMSPTSASELVGPPPDSPPPHRPGVSTPLTGTLAAAPSQAVAKNQDTAQGRTAYNTPQQSPIGGLATAARPYATGVSRPPDDGAVRSISPAAPVQPASTGGVQPASRAGAPQQVNPGTIIRDLNGRPAGSILSTLSASRPGFTAAQMAQQAGGVQPQVGPAQLMPAGMGNGSANSVQPVRPAQSGVMPAIPPGQVQPAIPPGRPQPLNLAAGTLQPTQAQRVSAYNNSAAPAQYAARISPAATDPANPDPNTSLRPAGSSAAGPMPASGPVTPQAVNPPSQLDTAQARLANYVNSGPGWSQIKNPVGRGFAEAGNIALSALAPGYAALAPGTTEHNQQLIGRQIGVVGNLQDQQTAQAQQANIASQTAERTAKTQQDIANAGKADRWDPNAVKTVNTAEGVKAFNPDTNQWEVIGGSPDKLQEGERPLGSTIPNLNKTLSDRYQVLNPGKPLPPQYVLPATATQKDYDRVDKALAGVESAQGTQTQRQTANAMRAQAEAALEANRQATRNGVPKPIPAGVRDRIESQKQTALSKARSSFDDGESSMDDYLNNWQQAQNDYEGRIEQTGQPVQHLDVRSNVDPQGKWIGNRSQPATAQPQAQPGRQPGFVTQKGNHVVVGDPVNVGGRSGVVTGFNGRTGKAQVKWDSGR